MQFTVELWADEKVIVDIAGDVASVDGKVIPVEMLEHTIRFGFRQLIRDAGAISKEKADGPGADKYRNELAMKKVAALIAGTLREGGGGQRLDAVEKEMRTVCLAKVEAACSKQGVTATQAQKLALAKKMMLRDEETLRPAAEAAIAARLETDGDLDLTDLAA